MTRPSDARKARARALPVLRLVRDGESPYWGARGPGACAGRKKVVERLARDGLLLLSGGEWTLTELGAHELDLP